MSGKKREKRKRKNANKCLTKSEICGILKKKSQRSVQNMAGLGRKDYDILDFIYKQTKINGFLFTRLFLLSRNLFHSSLFNNNVGSRISS